MSQLILRRLRYDDEAAFLRAFMDWDWHTGFEFGNGFETEAPFTVYVDMLAAHERGELLPEDFVPVTSLFGFVGENIIGRLSIRHSLNDFLLKVGGHIGYGVIPGFRLRGYAKAMLALALPMTKQLGIQKVLVTCDDNNIGSIKTIEANGGKLENTIFVEDGKPLKRRYWIDLS